MYQQAKSNQFKQSHGCRVLEARLSRVEKYVSVSLVASLTRRKRFQVPWAVEYLLKCGLALKRPHFNATLRWDHSISVGRLIDASKRLELICWTAVNSCPTRQQRPRGWRCLSARQAPARVLCRLVAPVTPVHNADTGG